MSQSLYTPARAPGPDGFSVDISPASAGWRYSSMRVLHVKPDEIVRWPTGDSEWIVLPLAGSCVRSRVATRHSSLEGRRVSSNA